MQIVIDIPESIYNTIEDDQFISREQLAVLQLHIIKGTPLPEEHGRLIDADAIKYNYFMCPETDNPTKIAVSKDKVDAMPTILKADKAESEEV